MSKRVFSTRSYAVALRLSAQQVVQTRIAERRSVQRVATNQNRRQVPSTSGSADESCRLMSTTAGSIGEAAKIGYTPQVV